MPHVLWLTFALAFLIQILFFTFAALFKTDKVTDLAYGFGFVILAWFLLFTQSDMSSSKIILTTMITAWGLRLATYLLIRIIKMGRDKRFDGIRENFFSFLKFWLFQALATWVIMLPSIYTFTVSAKTSTTSYLGITLFCFGLIIETIADWQKFVFKNDPKNKGKWISSGLWKYSQHPNYFGEITLWWGIFIFTLNNQSGWSYATIIGPIFITYILLFVSGIPTLKKRYDKKYKHNNQYQEYTKQTSLLIPWPKKN